MQKKILIFFISTPTLNFFLFEYVVCMIFFFFRLCVITKKKTRKNAIVEYLDPLMLQKEANWEATAAYAASVLRTLRRTDNERREATA